MRKLYTVTTTLGAMSTRQHADYHLATAHLKQAAQSGSATGYLLAITHFELADQQRREAGDRHALYEAARAYGSLAQHYMHADDPVQAQHCTDVLMAHCDAILASPIPPELFFNTICYAVITEAAVRENKTRARALLARGRAAFPDDADVQRELENLEAELLKDKVR